MSWEKWNEEHKGQKSAPSGSHPSIQPKHLSQSGAPHAMVQGAPSMAEGVESHTQALKPLLGMDAKLEEKKGAKTLTGLTRGHNEAHNALTQRGFVKTESSPRIDTYKHPDGTVAQKKQTYDRGAYKTSITLKKG